MRQRFISFSAVLCAFASLAGISANAQVRSQKVNAAASASLASETILEGTILKYTPNSSSAPLGAHITLHTTSGPVDVHVGDAKFLKLKNFNIAEGNAIRLSGHSKLVGTNTVFFARLLSQGNQSLAVRSASGMPLWRGGAGGRRSAVSANQKEGAR
ncbi:MAG TPA: hypothetical protein VK525_09585 [Candidatus Saccharimonadales bacterium]|nr:hypothetical protein [Candidatus Saccharimonadales bacterium]